MPVKDYYKILGIPFTASLQDIKKAYRQLAMRYHPDKNGGSELAKAHFMDVLEAYQVLSDPVRRSAYSQQRLHRQTSRKGFTSELITPQSILQKAKRLSRYISTLDNSHVDQHTLHQYIFSLLKDASLNVLIKSNDRLINDQIVAELLKAAKPLSFGNMEKISERLVRLAGANNKVIEHIHKDLYHRKIVSYWYTYRGMIVLLLTLALCWCIYVISQ